MKNKVQSRREPLKLLKQHKSRMSARFSQSTRVAAWVSGQGVGIVIRTSPAEIPLEPLVRVVSR